MQCLSFLGFFVTSLTLINHQSWSKTFVPPKPTCLHNMCNSTVDYPEEYIQKAVEKHSEFQNYFGTVIEPSKNTETPQNVPSIVNRFGGDEEEERNMCNTRRHIIYPRVAKDIYDNTKYIVNTGRFVQAISFDSCAEDSCSLPDPVLNIKTFCRQEYHTVRLVYLGEDGELKYGHFSIPSTCVCAFKPIYDFS